MRVLSRTDARRLAVRAQLLTADRPDDLEEVVHRLTLLQLDPTNAIAPSADLVLWSRLGDGYDPRDLRDALDELRLVELDGMVRPAADIALYRDEMARWPVHAWQAGSAAWIDDNDSFRLDLLERLRTDGPLTTKELPDTCVRPWRSSGWNNNRNVRMMLDRLVERGEVAVAGSRGRDKLWDLAERVYAVGPEDAVPYAEALRERDRRRLASLGIARAKGQKMPLEPVDVGAVGEPAVVDGVPGEWRVDATLLDTTSEPRAALLSPFDRLVYDRKRLLELFDFDYTLEMYKPAAKRRWGYYALPVLWGDRLIGKLDARAERDRGVLVLNALHEDGVWSARQRAAVHEEVAALGEWLGLRVVEPR